MSKWLRKFLENEPQNRTDKTDRFDLKSNMSVLSVPLQGSFDKNLGNMPETRTDNTDRFDTGDNMSVLSGSISNSFVKSLILDAYEERIAIAQYDGQQNPIQAQRTAYQDAFISVLNALPYADGEEGDWFEHRVKAAKEWLLRQGIEK